MSLRSQHNVQIACSQTAQLPGTSVLSDRLKAVLNISGKQTQGERTAGSDSARADLLKEERAIQEAKEAEIKRAAYEETMALVSTGVHESGPVNIPLPRRPASPARVRADGERESIPANRGVPATDVSEAERDAIVREHGETYVQALLHDGVALDFINSHLSDSLEVMEGIKMGQLASMCVRTNEEDLRRREILVATDAIRKRLNMPEWPVATLRQESWDDFCAFEALIFLACPAALVRCSVSLARAKLRGLLGQREMCGFIDTALMCVGSIDTATKSAALAFLTSNNKSHVDIATNVGFMALTNNVSLSFSNGITLSKMFMFVEELLLSNTLSQGAVMAAKNRFVEANGSSMCAEIERDGATAYAWAAILHELISGEAIEEGLGKNRYPSLYDVSTVKGQYLSHVFIWSNRAWWTNSSVLSTALHLINMENSRAFNSSSSWDAMQGISSTTSCLSVGEANERFMKTKTLRPLQVMAAKTWALTTGVAMFSVKAVWRTARVGTPVVLQLAAACTASSAALMASAPVTTAVGMGATTLASIEVVRRYAGDAPADYITSMGASVAQGIAEPLGRAAVRQGAGRVAQHATSLLNSAALGVAMFFSSNVTEEPFNATAAGDHAREMVRDREGTFTATVAVAHATDMFRYLGRGGVKLTGKVLVWPLRAAGIIKGRRLNNI